MLVHSRGMWGEGDPARNLSCSLPPATTAPGHEHARLASASSAVDGSWKASDDTPQGTPRRTHPPPPQLTRVVFVPQSSGIGLSRSSTPSTAATDSYGEESTASLGGGSGTDAAAESLRTTLNKRIGVFDYLRHAHEGKSYWFNVSRSRRARR